MSESERAAHLSVWGKALPSPVELAALRLEKRALERYGVIDPRHRYGDRRRLP
jgi:hypothetical protein